jgi:hypothetical protein
MTFLQKYLVAPTLGAAGLFVGYRVYRNRIAESGDRPAPPVEAGSELGKLAEQVRELASRLAAVESKASSGEWLEMINSRFIALEERMTVHGERISSMEGNYQNIEGSLESILRKLDGMGREKAQAPVPIESLKDRIHHTASEAVPVAQLVG